jgi:hypothetical protein
VNERRYSSVCVIQTNIVVKIYYIGPFLRLEVLRCGNFSFNDQRMTLGVNSDEVFETEGTIRNSAQVKIVSSSQHSSPTRMLSSAQIYNRVDTGAGKADRLDSVVP